MALVLTLREGEDFYADRERFVVTKIHDGLCFTLTSDRGSSHRVSDSHAVEIKDEVFVSAGDNPPSLTARVVISAPRSIAVFRGELLRAREKHEEACG